MADKSDANQIIQDCETAIKAHQADLTRAYEIWDAYYAVEGRQWDAKKREDLRQQDRHAWQFDILGPKVETLAGSLVAELPDMDWLPVEGETSQGIEAVREKYYAEKEQFNYDDTILYTVRDGCIHSGWCQMKESKRYTPTGGISLERCRPGYIIPDPLWVTDDDRDLEVLFKIGYYLPERIAALFPKKSDEITRAIEERKRNGNRFVSNITAEQRDDYQRRYKDTVGDQFRVIEKFYVKSAVGERLIGMMGGDNGQGMGYVPFPVTKDRSMLQQFAENNKINWDTVSAVEYREKRQCIQTVTDLDTNILLEDAETREQVNGLSFFHFTCMRYCGHDKGVAESILDAQRVINEKESYLLEYMAKAGGGSELWNEELFRNENQKKSFKKNKNKFGHIEFADLDSVKNVKVSVDPAQVPSAVFAEIQRMYTQTIPMVSRVPDVMNAQSGSEDTGVLFERKYQIGRMANVLYDKYIKQLINNIAEAYYYQFQITHGDVEQEVKTRAGGKIVINKKEIVNGQSVTINDTSQLPRSKVVVTESKSNPVYQLRKKMEIETIMRSIPPTDNLRLQATLGMYFDSMSMNDETKASMDMVNDLEMKKAMLQYMTEIAGLEAQLKGAKVMGKQATQQLAQMEGAGQPQPGPQPGMTPTVNNEVTPGDNGGGNANGGGLQPGQQPTPPPQDQQNLPQQSQMIQEGVAA